MLSFSYYQLMQLNIYQHNSAEVVARGQNYFRQAEI